MQTFFKPRTSNLSTSNDGQKGKGIVEEPISAPPSSPRFVRPAPISGYVKLDLVPTTTPMMKKLQSTFVEFSKLVPLVGKLDEVNYDLDVGLRPLDELQDQYQSPRMDDKDYTRKMSTIERAELRIGDVTNRSTIRSSVKELIFDGDVDVDGDVDEDEDEEFIDDFEMSEYHFTLAQMVAKMTNPMSGQHLLVSSNGSILQPVAVAPPSLEPK
ncbi:hypothetical protein R1flu_012707 [Riccia fluitans]|uniref:Uncharacterized protein n=1 Tax=Riccia fluitans TaxID=41844 RepID=A0ABD1ZBD0_9MARC